MYYEDCIVKWKSQSQSKCQWKFVGRFEKTNFKTSFGKNRSCRNCAASFCYGIVNCGFYEGIQATFALQVLQNWCIKSRCIWGGGIGVGGGGCLVTIPTLENGHGPKEPINKALGTMADKMLQKEVLENQYVSIAFPRFLYKMAAQMGWRQMIRANGGKKKDLGKQL